MNITTGCLCMGKTWKKMVILLLSFMLNARMFEANDIPPPYAGGPPINKSFRQAKREVVLLERKISSNVENLSSIDIFFTSEERSMVKRIRMHPKLLRGYHHRCMSPSNRREVYLQSKTGFFLQANHRGQVSGHINKTVYAKMELQIISKHIRRIYSVETGLYLAINKKGKVVTKGCDEDTYFFAESLENHRESFRSVRYPTVTIDNMYWYLAIRKKSGSNTKGRVKRASRTLVGDKGSHFLVVDVF